MNLTTLKIYSLCRFNSNFYQYRFCKTSLNFWGSPTYCSFWGIRNVSGFRKVIGGMTPTLIANFNWNRINLNFILFSGGLDTELLSKVKPI